jgi:two-component system response regulator
MHAGRILLVEDSSDDELLILRALGKAHLANLVDVARDGADALDFIFGSGPHEGRGVITTTVILLDLKLPKVDGITVLRRIREDSRTMHSPVVVLTSSNEQEDLLQTYRLGVNSYIRKPIEFGQFAKTVADLGLYWLLLNEVPA